MTDQMLPFEAQRDEKRRMNARQRVLERLKAGPATTMELIAVGGTRAPARTYELREEGWPIRVDSMGNDLFVYTLTGPQDVANLG